MKVMICDGHFQIFSGALSRTEKSDLHDDRSRQIIDEESS